MRGGDSQGGIGCGVRGQPKPHVGGFSLGLIPTASEQSLNVNMWWDIFFTLASTVAPLNLNSEFATVYSSCNAYTQVRK